MEVYTLPVTLFITLAGNVALVLLYRADHKYSGMLSNLIFVGCPYLVFSVLYTLKTTMRMVDIDMYLISSDGVFYAFSIICFSINVAIIFGHATLDRLLSKIFYGIFFFISLCLIVGIDNILQRCLYIEENHDNWELMEFVQTIKSEVKRVDKVLYCYYDLIDPVTARICLEYLLIFVPASVLLYMTIRQSSTFNEWLSKSCIEKCTGCQLNVSFCYYIAIALLISIWFLRPIFLLTAKLRGTLYDSPSIHCDIVPMVSLNTICVLVLIYVIIQYGF